MLAGVKMKNNKAFKKYMEKVEEYSANPSKSKQEECQKEASDLIRLGWVTPSMKAVYDFGIEKHRTMGQKDLTIEVYDKAYSMEIIMIQTYGIFIPKGAVKLLPGRKLIFDPHQPQMFSEDGVQKSNLFIKTKFLSFNQEKGNMIDSINWESYPNIKALFVNVFKKHDRMDYFANWLAYSFQTLGKAGTAIISKGVQGTGKGVIYEQIIQYAVGERYTTILENEALKSRFNGELENKIFVLANEIKADFREGNTVYERLKMYVTDSHIRFEEKNTKARMIKNFFNIWFHSNNDIPLQIQGSDRRYTVFNTSGKKLEQVSEELGYEHIKFYIEAIKRERDNFIFDLMRLKYDMHKATKPMHTIEKEMIYEASMTKLEVLCDKIKKYDIDYFVEPIEVFYDSEESEKQMIELRLMKLDSPTDFIKELKIQFDGNHIKANMLVSLYKIFVKDTDTNTTVGRQFNKHFTPTKQKKIIGKNFRYRAIDEDRKVVFADEIPVEIEEADGTIKNTVINRMNGANDMNSY